MRGLVICLILITVLFSCTEQKPKDLLEVKVMQDVMTDLLLAEGFTENFLLLDTSKKKDEWLASEYSKVMSVYHISQDQFRSSIAYYMKRPDLFKEIIDTVNQRGLRHRDDTYQQNGKKKRRIKLD